MEEENIESIAHLNEEIVDSSAILLIDQSPHPVSESLISPESKNQPSNSFIGEESFTPPSLPRAPPSTNQSDNNEFNDDESTISFGSSLSEFSLNQPTASPTVKTNKPELKDGTNKSRNKRDCPKEQQQPSSSSQKPRNPAKIKINIRICDMGLAKSLREATELILTGQILYKGTKVRSCKLTVSFDEKEIVRVTPQEEALSLLKWVNIKTSKSVKECKEMIDQGRVLWGGKVCTDANLLITPQQWQSTAFLIAKKKDVTVVALPPPPLPPKKVSVAVSSPTSPVPPLPSRQPLSSNISAISHLKTDLATSLIKQRLALTKDHARYLIQCNRVLYDGTAISRLSINTKDSLQLSIKPVNGDLPFTPDEQNLLEYCRGLAEHMKESGKTSGRSGTICASFLKTPQGALLSDRIKRICSNIVAVEEYGKRFGVKTICSENGRIDFVLGEPNLPVKKENVSVAAMVGNKMVEDKNSSSQKTSSIPLKNLPNDRSSQQQQQQSPRSAGAGTVTKAVSGSNVVSPAKSEKNVVSSSRVPKLKQLSVPSNNSTLPTQRGTMPSSSTLNNNNNNGNLNSTTTTTAAKTSGPGKLKAPPTSTMSPLPRSAATAKPFVSSLHSPPTHKMVQSSLNPSASMVPDLDAVRPSTTKGSSMLSSSATSFQPSSFIQFPGLVAPKDVNSLTSVLRSRKPNQESSAASSSSVPGHKRSHVVSNFSVSASNQPHVYNSNNGLRISQATANLTANFYPSSNEDSKRRLDHGNFSRTATPFAVHDISNDDNNLLVLCKELISRNLAIDVDDAKNLINSGVVKIEGIDMQNDALHNPEAVIEIHCDVLKMRRLLPRACMPFEDAYSWSNPTQRQVLWALAGVSCFVSNLTVEAFAVGCISAPIDDSIEESDRATLDVTALFLPESVLYKSCKIVLESASRVIIERATQRGVELWTTKPAAYRRMAMVNDQLIISPASELFWPLLGAYGKEDAAQLFLDNLLSSKFIGNSVTEENKDRKTVLLSLLDLQEFCTKIRPSANQFLLNSRISSTASRVAHRTRVNRLCEELKGTWWEVGLKSLLEMPEVGKR